ALAACAGGAAAGALACRAALAAFPGARRPRSPGGAAPLRRPLGVGPAAEGAGVPLRRRAALHLADEDRILPRHLALRDRAADQLLDRAERRGVVRLGEGAGPAARGV